VRQLGDRPSISQFLADMAGVWATQGQPERSALLFGASQVLRDNMGVSMYQAQRRAYEQDVAYGAAQLDAATWEAAWAKGRLMSLDDVYAIAVEDLPPPPLSPQSVDNFDLTARELEVLRLLVAGLTYAQIAEQLMLSFHTVHAHLRTSYSKMGVTSRGQAARFAMDHGLV
jgi:DNA-binding NarL/FixJ family response regulator